MVDRLEQRYAGQVTFYIYPEADKDEDVGDFANRQGVKAVPTTVLVSEKGVEISRWVGTTAELGIAQQLDETLSPR